MFFPRRGEYRIHLPHRLLPWAPFVPFVARGSQSLLFANGSRFRVVVPGSYKPGLRNGCTGGGVIENSKKTEMKRPPVTSDQKSGATSGWPLESSHTGGGDQASLDRPRRG